MENLFGINIPDKAKALRMVFCELSRILDHLNCIGDLSLSAGNEIIKFKCLDMKERIYELFEKVAGSRLKVSINVIGGLSRDLPQGWIIECLNNLKYIEKNIIVIDKLLTRSPTWMSRTNVCCSLSAKDALDYGLSGPNLRATGINYDLRKASPYYFYRDVDFDVPLGINGNSYDRYLVRLEEIRQSLRIITQILDNLPVSDIIADHSFTQVLTQEENKGSENSSKFFKETPATTEKSHYSFIESANGELGFFLVSDGGICPWRVKIRAPSFAHAQAFESSATELLIDDALVAFSSFNITPGELDR